MIHQQRQNPKEENFGFEDPLKKMPKKELQRNHSSIFAQ
jgi:hypothetical protein